MCPPEKQRVQQVDPSSPELGHRYKLYRRMVTKSEAKASHRPLVAGCSKGHNTRLLVKVQVKGGFCHWMKCLMLTAQTLNDVIGPRWQRSSYPRCFGFISGRREEVETRRPSLVTLYGLMVSIKLLFTLKSAH